MCKTLVQYYISAFMLEHKVYIFLLISLCSFLFFPPCLTCLLCGLPPTFRFGWNTQLLVWEVTDGPTDSSGSVSKLVACGMNLNKWEAGSGQNHLPSLSLSTSWGNSSFLTLIRKMLCCELYNRDLQVARISGKPVVMSWGVTEFQQTGSNKSADNQLSEWV